jgi:hypothetical protein
LGVSTLLMVLLGLSSAHVFWQAYGHWAKVNETLTMVITQPHTAPKAAERHVPPAKRQWLLT